MAIIRTDGVMSENGDWFYYSALWNSWSRVLVRGGPQQGFVKEISVDITQYSWENQHSINKIHPERLIKVYTPSKEKGDIFTHLLPLSVYNTMKDNLTVNDLEWFLDADILRNTDIEKLADEGNGETPYKLVEIEGFGFPQWINRVKRNEFLFKLPDEASELIKAKKLEKLTDRFTSNQRRRFTFNN